ncbi:facilitated trehalose transporter Tret1-like [Sitodiplosis mosellana]|uniref:facilitated trehalose transporter Tret1-like n=1 Tax=Sitodiplosis mosellana TaxID=263140 RepID=UPI002443C930|nr:facilitated trehalose transporter Tret1-like [Sitodiplosis mosellana]
MFSFSPVYKQFLTIIACNLLVLSYGWSSGWSSINLNELENAASTYSVKGLSKDETSLVISILYAGSFTGTCIVIAISQMIGIKRTIHLFGLPLVASSLLLLYAQNVYYLYASRFLCGMVSGSLVVGIPTLVNDISSDNVRGALNSLYDLFSNSGTIISFFLGKHLSMDIQVKTQLIVPIIFLLIMCLLPESPEYWIRKCKEKRAIKSCKFYKGKVDKLERIGFTSNHPCVEAATKTIDEEDDEQLTLQDFLSPKAKKAICVAFLSLLLSFLSCATVTFNYVERIFERTVSSNTKDYSLGISIVQLVANVIFLTIVERFKRRTLYIWSSILTTVSYCVFGTYCLVLLKQPKYELISVLCFVFITFISCMGMVPVPYILAVEIFPKKIRKVCLTAAILMMWIVLFALDRVFPNFLDFFELHHCFYILGVMSSLNAIFGIFCVPETKGKTHEEIMALLDN